ncbi:DUF427 domain-containing protein [Labrys sp. 22185]
MATVSGERLVDAIWFYEAPYDAVAAIKDRLALYPDREFGREPPPHGSH